MGGKAANGRQEIGYREALETAELFIEHALSEGIKEGIGTVKIAGSLRRKKEIVNDIDIVVIGNEKLGEVLERLWGVQNNGLPKHVGLFNGIQIDVYETTEESWPAMLAFATGSAQENIRLRAKAKSMGFKLNEKGLYIADTREKMEMETEMDIYRWLEEEYREPEDRI